MWYDKNDKEVTFLQIKLDENTRFIISKLESNGFSAYAVGGALRDILLGREATDYDIATSALPEETKKTFEDHRVVETGIAHGTVTVILDGIPYEITTFRTESEYTDHRRPDSVSFVTDIKEDLSRRDFTINAIAYSEKEGMIDPFGGVSDIERKLIKTVGDPIKRFTEDALRIIRALRFSSVLGFQIEKNTSDAIFALADNLSKIAPERIYTEIKKLLCCDNAKEVLSVYLPVLKKIIPINGNFYDIEKLPKDFKIRMTCLCGDSVTEALNILRADNATKTICSFLANSSKIPDDAISLKKYISSLGRENALLAAKYRRCLYGEDMEENIEKIVASDSCLFVTELAINGNDLKEIGINGKKIGETLKILLDLVITEKLDNEKNALLLRAKRLM